MNRSTRKPWIIASAALTMFLGGVVMASPNSCLDVDTSSCVYIDMTQEDQCCADLGDGPRLWQCTREMFDCLQGDELVHNQPGPGFNFHSPGPVCTPQE